MSVVIVGKPVARSTFSTGLNPSGRGLGTREDDVDGG
jgi:hypothetical protein